MYRIPGEKRMQEYCLAFERAYNWFLSAVEECKGTDSEFYIKKLYEFCLASYAVIAQLAYVEISSLSDNYSSNLVQRIERIRRMKIDLRCKHAAYLRQLSLWENEEDSSRNSDLPF